MASQGPQSPSTVNTSDIFGGMVDWTNPTNITSSNNSRASVAIAAEETSYYLVATGFGFTIPDGATITDVVVEIECQSSTPGFSCGIYLVKGSAIQTSGTEYGSEVSTNVTGSDAYIQVVHEDDRPSLWGVTLSASDINNSGFGVALSIYDVSSMSYDLAIDHVRITVYYTEAVGGAASYSVGSMMGVG